MNRSTGSLLLVVIAGVLGLAACGSGENGSGSSTTTVENLAAQPSEDPPSGEAAEQDVDSSGASADAESAAETLQDLLDAVPGEDVAIVWGTGDLEIGDIRMSFLVVDEQGELVQAPTAEFIVGRIEVDEIGETEVEAGRTSAVAAAVSTASLESIDAGPHEHEDDGAAPHDHIDATDLYVAHLDLSEPGLYWAVATPAEGGIQAFGTFEVREDGIAPGVGDEAIPSNTPTLDDAPPEALTTLDPPAEELLRFSIADSLAQGVPFVVTFATPAFCQTRVCGPVVEIVDRARAMYEAKGIRFIQVEIYNDNDPDNGVNEWVAEWDLPSEPWTFLVDGSGIIQARFEGAMSARELTEALEQALL